MTFTIWQLPTKMIAITKLSRNVNREAAFDTL
jgi:hypothetical protein